MTVNVFFLFVFMAANLFNSIENNQGTSALNTLNRTIRVRFVNNPLDITSIISREPALKKLSRSKRSLIELYNMVFCATGCNPLAYKGYGCYCGFLGSGVPVDEIDSCCAQHDACYERSKCLFLFHYVILYSWKCINSIPYCVNWNQGRSCSDDLCECDRMLAECLRETSCPSSKAQCYSRWTW